jgi:hypothetical protein
MEWGQVLCPVCWKRFETEGPHGVLPHLVAKHPESDVGRRILRELTALSPDQIEAWLRGGVR